VNADGRPLVIITGANSGGKSTFLRSVGIAQLMMQCGMFVTAGKLRASLCNRVFTHFIREEDPEMISGRLDEELSRMSAIADHISRHNLILFNESFAATNEREGSEVGRQIVRALLEDEARVFFVSHQFDFADGFHRQQPGTTLFLARPGSPTGGAPSSSPPPSPCPPATARTSTTALAGGSRSGQVIRMAPNQRPDCRPERQHGREPEARRAASDSQVQIPGGRE
jgi:MutS domain V